MDTYREHHESIDEDVLSPAPFDSEEPELADDDSSRTQVEAPASPRSLKDRVFNRKASFAFHAPGNALHAPGTNLSRRKTVMVTLEGQENPWNWSRGKKAWITGWTAFLLMNSTLASSAPSGASTEIKQRFGVSTTADVLVVSMYIFGYICGPPVFAPLSETYGRRKTFIIGVASLSLFHGLCAAVNNFGALLFFRFMAGFAGSPPLTNSGATIGDIYEPASRGIPMALFSLAPFAGPSVGPLIAGFLSSSPLGYKWLFIILCIFSAASCIVTILFLPETYPPILRYEKARKMRKNGQSEMHSELDLQRKNWKHNVLIWIERPFEMLIKEPILATMTIYLSLTFAIIYMLFGAYPIIFGQVHQLSPGLSGCAFLSIMVGCILAVPACLFYNKQYLRDVERNGGVHLPEFRLPMGTVGVLCFAISLFWLGWTGYRKDLSVFLPMASGILTGFGSVLLFRAFQTYLIDLYKRYSASALAAQVIIRSVFGGVLPLFTAKMFETMTIQWACSFLGFLMLLALPGSFIFMKFGSSLRARSKFASPVEEVPEQKATSPVQDVEKGVKAGSNA